MTVNELAKAAGVEPNGLLYYARTGLLRPKQNTQNGDKRFRPSVLRRLGLCLLAALGAGALQAEPLLRGKEIYQGSCVACHGADGTGVLPGVPDLTGKDGPLAGPDELLVERMMKGFKSPSSPMAMPAKGGDPSLTEADMSAVLQYMRAEFAH